MKATAGSLHTCPKKGGWGLSKAGQTLTTGNLTGKIPEHSQNPGQTGSQSSRGTLGLGSKACIVCMSDLGTGRGGAQQAHPGPLRRWRPLVSTADEDIGGAVFTDVSVQVLLGMGVTACAQAGFSHPSPVSQFKESTVENRKGTFIQCDHIGRCT